MSDLLNKQLSTTSHFPPPQLRLWEQQIFFLGWRRIILILSNADFFPQTHLFQGPERKVKTLTNIIKGLLLFPVLSPRTPNNTSKWHQLIRSELMPKVEAMKQRFGHFSLLVKFDLIILWVCEPIRASYFLKARMGVPQPNPSACGIPSDMKSKYEEMRRSNLQRT